MNGIRRLQTAVLTSEKRATQTEKNIGDLLESKKMYNTKSKDRLI
jgi:hypothetical protein